MAEVKRLSRESFDRACQFLKTQARRLDRAMFEHRFEGAPVERVIDELARFRNHDGGFGHALEPDLRTPTSSALATGIGLRTLKELGCTAEHPMVAGAMRFLLETFDPQTKAWRVAPLDANEYPHAGWWHDEDGSLARLFDDFTIIPRAELVGLLNHYAALVPGEWLSDVTEETVASLETVRDEAFGGGGDALRCALSLAETEAVPQLFKDRLIPRLRSMTLKFVSQDQREWAGYCAAPLKVAPLPQSLVADMLWDGLQAHLDYEIDRQTSEGTWEPTWVWGEFYPDVWKQAKLEWRGHLTLETLTSLRAFGRVEE